MLVVAIVDVISMAVVEVCRSWNEVRRQGRLMEESGRRHVRELFFDEDSASL
jgi:hypothetical protein